MSKPFAAFDIDGTVIRWQLYHAISDALVRQGFINAKTFESVKIARMNWKRRTGEDSFKAYEEQLVEVFDNALQGLPANMLELAAQTVFGEHKDQVYIYTRDLITDLKAQGYLLFALSGSPAIIVEKLANYYGFDDYAATTYPTKNGYLTGSKDLLVGKKAALLQTLVEKHGASREGSIAIGDSEGDIDMLSSVERPIAFNPSKRLFEQAKALHWPIVIERKNVVYKLYESDEHYQLAS